MAVQTRVIYADGSKDSWESLRDPLKCYIDFYSKMESVKIIFQNEALLRVLRLSNEIWEYWDDNFPYNSESEDSVPDWLK